MSRKILLIFIGIFIIFASLILLSNKKFKANNQFHKLSDFLIGKKIEKNTLAPLSLESIFNENHQWLATISAQRKITLLVTGDVMLGRSVNFQSWQKKDWRWPFLKTADFLKRADLTFINLESPLVADCSLTQEGMIFCGDLKNIEGLVFAGVDIASLANNHTMNYQQIGLESTIKILNLNGILPIGINGSAIRETKGIKFAFLGYNDISPQVGISNVSEEKIKKEIIEAKGKADIIIVSFHWGQEYVDKPSQRQKSLGYLAIDNGADLVIGNHPHWIQPVEIYKGKLITYSHGNFIFDQMWSQETRQGIVGQYTFIDKQLADVQYFPVVINDYGQPVWMEGQEKQRIINDLKSKSF